MGILPGCGFVQSGPAAKGRTRLFNGLPFFALNPGSAGCPIGQECARSGIGRKCAGLYSPKKIKKNAYLPEAVPDRLEGEEYKYAGRQPLIFLCRVGFCCLGGTGAGLLELSRYGSSGRWCAFFWRTAWLCGIMAGEKLEPGAAAGGAPFFGALPDLAGWSFRIR